MEKGRSGARTSGDDRVGGGAATAMTGSPSAVIIGHQEPPGTWIGAGGSAGGSSIGSWRSVRQRASRCVTVGITEKLYGGGGEGMLHSSVAPPHGSFGAIVPRVRLRHTLYTKTKIATAIKNAPTVDTRLRPPP